MDSSGGRVRLLTVTAACGSGGRHCRRRHTRACRQAAPVPARGSSHSTWNRTAARRSGCAVAALPVRRRPCAPTNTRWPVRNSRRRGSRTRMAARLYRRAIDAGRAAGMLNDSAGVPALARAWEQLGDALRCTGEPAAAARALTAARRLLEDDPLAQARICHRHAEVAERTESLTDAVRWLKRSLRYIDGIDDPRGDVAGAVTLYLAGQEPPGTVARVDAAVPRGNCAGRERRRATGARASVLHTRLGAVRARSPRAGDPLRTSTDDLRESGPPRDQSHGAQQPRHVRVLRRPLGRAAVELYRQAGACSERAGKPGDVAFTDCNVGEILSDQGRLEEAEIHLERARRVWTATGDGQSVAFVNVLMGRLAVLRGHTRVARRRSRRWPTCAGSGSMPMPTSPKR